MFKDLPTVLSDLVSHHLTFEYFAELYRNIPSLSINLYCRINKDKIDIDDQVIENNFEMVKELVKNGFEFTDHSLEYAVVNNNIEIVIFIYENAVSNKLPSRGAFSCACRFNYSEIAKFLFSNSEIDIKEREESLLWACKNNDMGIVKLLQPFPFDRSPNVFIIRNYRPEVRCMKYACENDNLEMVKLFYRACRRDCVDYCIINDKLDILKHVILAYTSWDKRKECITLARNNHYNLKMIKFLRDHFKT